jgi:hypothetical protein
MSFNYCSYEPTYYYNCSGPSGCVSYSGYKVSNSEDNYTINVGTYSACYGSQNPTPTGPIGMSPFETHAPLGDTITYGTWNVWCGQQNPTPTGSAILV